MRCLGLIAGFVLIAAAPAPTSARPLLAGEAQPGCEALMSAPTPDQAPRRLQRQARLCADMIQKLLQERETASQGRCPAQSVRLSSAAGAVALYLRDYPSSHEQPFEGIARTALLRFLPCRAS
jgi:hypothetical protein